MLRFACYTPLLLRGVTINTLNVRVQGQRMQAPNAVFNPASDSQCEDVRNQLRRILDSSAFHNSKRYAAVLKYIVDQTLEGAGSRLKERTIGIEVFNRPPDYDTATDHAVRSAVAEVRKRLAQYYQDDPLAKLKIDVLPGSYMPQFHWVEEPAAVLPISVQEAPGEAGPVILLKPEKMRARFWLRPWWVAVTAVILLASGAWLIIGFRSQEPLDGFWEPIISSRAPVLLCVGNSEGGQGKPTPVQNAPVSLMDFHGSPAQTILVDDAITIAKLADLMGSKGKRIQLASQSQATFTDLQNGPTILVGLLNNNWTERLVPRLRFTVERTTPTKVVLRDRNNPSNQDWTIDYAAPYLDVTRDYAIVLRMVDPKTEQVVVGVAGLTVFGTHAAGDFLTNGNEMKKLASIAPAGWEKKNMEIVLATDVIRGRSGPASVVAAQFW